MQRFFHVQFYTKHVVPIKCVQLQICICAAKVHFVDISLQYSFDFELNFSIFR